MVDSSSSKEVNLLSEDFSADAKCLDYKALAGVKEALKCFIERASM